MANRLLWTFVYILVFDGLAQSAVAATSSPSFDEWLATFDPSTAKASKFSDCLSKMDGFYPSTDPETVCSDLYTACVFHIAYQQKCNAGEVFDSTPTVRRCVDPYDAKSAVCEYTVPPPACNANNVGVYQPIAKCSDIFYVCTTATAQPLFDSCSQGYYFDPISMNCQTKVGAKACQAAIEATEAPPVTVPVYGCGSDKITGFAYAITECGPSYYTCNRNTSPSPIPASCSTYGTGKVFDYKATPTKPTSALCVLKSTVPECDPALSTTTPSTTTPSTTTPTTTTPTTTTPAGYCSNKPSDSYAMDEPDTCSVNYRVCLGGNEFNQTCTSGEVFDSAPTVKNCANRYEAISDACEATYPTPVCSASNVGQYMPVGRCSTLYYLCTSSTGSPNFSMCTTGNYFNPKIRTCSSKTGVVACQ